MYMAIYPSFDFFMITIMFLGFKYRTFFVEYLLIKSLRISWALSAKKISICLPPINPLIYRFTFQYISLSFCFLLSSIIPEVQYLTDLPISLSVSLNISFYISIYICMYILLPFRLRGEAQCNIFNESL